MTYSYQDATSDSPDDRFVSHPGLWKPDSHQDTGRQPQHKHDETYRKGISILPSMVWGDVFRHIVPLVYCMVITILALGTTRTTITQLIKYLLLTLVRPKIS